MLTSTEWLFGQQGAIFASAILASCFALWQIRAATKRAGLAEAENRRRDRVKATLNVLTNREWDRDFIETRTGFTALRDTDEGLEKFGKKGLNGFPEQEDIRKALNDYELMAIGIKQGILDENFYKLWCKSSVITDFKASQGYINALNAAETEKRGRPTHYFCEFCELGLKWSEEPNS